MHLTYLLTNLLKGWKETFLFSTWKHAKSKKRFAWNIVLSFYNPSNILGKSVNKKNRQKCVSILFHFHNSNKSFQNSPNKTQCITQEVVIAALKCECEFSAESLCYVHFMAQIYMWLQKKAKLEITFERCDAFEKVSSNLRREFNSVEK